LQWQWHCNGDTNPRITEACVNRFVASEVTLIPKKKLICSRKQLKEQESDEIMTRKI
jgi:hypothetical protein